LFDRKEVFRSFAEALDGLGGRYVTAEDVGTKVADMELVRSLTPHVYGILEAPGQAGGDPSTWTAQGVFASIQAVADRLGQPIAGARIAVQGLGNVGMHLAELLHEQYYVRSGPESTILRLLSARSPGDPDHVCDHGLQENWPPAPL
jgi:leucine dehydrogenase